MRCLAVVLRMILLVGTPTALLAQDVTTIANIEIAVAEHLRGKGIHDTGVVAIDPRFFVPDSSKVVFDKARRADDHLAKLLKPGRRIVATIDSAFRRGANSYIAVSRVTVKGEAAVLWGVCGLRYVFTKPRRDGSRRPPGIGENNFIVRLTLVDGVWTVVEYTPLTVRDRIER